MRKVIVAAGVILGTLSVAAQAGWDTNVSKDKMTGEISAYATSPMVTPTERMRFPYADTKAWLGVGCNGKEEWAFIGFSTAPNLNQTEIEDGYHRILTRIKWDSRLEEVVLIQEWGAAFVHFRYDQPAIENIAKSRSVLLELNWHSNGETYFSFPLSGSSAALQKIRTVCAR